MGRVYAVVSAKGGVGKTTTTSNLAAALAAAGESVAVVDGDLGMANLGGALGVVPTGATLHDVLAGEADVADATYEGPHGVGVVPGSTDLDAFARADPEGLEAVLDALRDRYEYVLLDTGAGLSNDTVVPLTYVDEAVLVSTTEPGSLGDTEKTRQVAERLDVPVAGAVLTRVDPERHDGQSVDERLDADLLAVVPRDETVRDAVAAAEPLSTFAPGSPAASAYRTLASKLTGVSVEEPDVATGVSEDVESVSEDGDAATAESTPDADVADPTPDDPDPKSDADDDGSIIVAGDHEGDADPEDVESDTVAEAEDVESDTVAEAEDVESDTVAETEDDAEHLSADEGESDAADADDTADDPLADPLDDADEADTDDADEADTDDAAEPDTDAAAGDGEDTLADSTDGDSTAGPGDVSVAASEADVLVEPVEPDDETENVRAVTFADDGENRDGDDVSVAVENAEDDAAEPGDDSENDSEGDEEPDDDEGVYTTALVDEAEADDDDDDKKGLFGRFLG